MVAGQITFVGRFVLTAYFLALVPLNNRMNGPHVLVELALPFALEAAVRSRAAMFLTTLDNGFRRHFWLLSSAAFGEAAVRQRV